MNYRTVKNQLFQIIIGEVAKYYQKQLTPSGLSLDDLKALELLSKITAFEQEIFVSDSDIAPPSKQELDELLKKVQNEPKNE